MTFALARQAKLCLAAWQAFMHGGSCVFSYGELASATSSYHMFYPYDVLVCVQFKIVLAFFCVRWCIVAEISNACAPRGWPRDQTQSQCIVVS